MFIGLAGAFWMIKALTGSFERILRNPFLLLPALGAIALVLVLFYVFSFFMVNLILNAMLLGTVPDAPLQALPFQFFALYPGETIALVVFLIISGIVFFSLSYCFAAFARMNLGGKASIGKAVSETFSVLGKIVSFALFIALILVFIACVLWLLALVYLLVPLLGIVLFALAGLGCFYLFVKLAFVVQALALEQSTVKKALENSWQMAVGRFWHVLVFLIILAAVNYALVFIGSGIADLLVDDILGIIALAVFWSISLAFAGMAMPLYYAEKKLGKQG